MLNEILILLGLVLRDKLYNKREIKYHELFFLEHSYNIIKKVIHADFSQQKVKEKLYHSKHSSKYKKSKIDQLQHKSLQLISWKQEAYHKYHKQNDGKTEIIFIFYFIPIIFLSLIMKGLGWNVKIWRRPTILIIVHIMNIFALVRVDNFPLINSSCCVLILYFAQFTVTCPVQINQTAMHKHISCITDVFYFVSFATHPIKFLLPYSIIILRIYLPCRRILLI